MIRDLHFIIIMYNIFQFNELICEKDYMIVMTEYFSYDVIIDMTFNDV